MKSVPMQRRGTDCCDRSRGYALPKVWRLRSHERNHGPLRRITMVSVFGMLVAKKLNELETKGLAIRDKYCVC